MVRSLEARMNLGNRGMHWGWGGTLYHFTEPLGARQG